jgi:hypothetical protein
VDNAPDVGKGRASREDIMDSRSRLRLGRRLLAAGLVLIAAPATPQVRDHLKCFRIKDSSSFAATVDLRPADDGIFSNDADCVVKVRSRELCVPIEKEVVETDAPETFVPGAALENAMLCYKLRCSNETVPDSIDVSDQFGTHTLTGLKSYTICAPAVFGDPPTTTTTTTLPHGPPVSCANATAPNCDGTCGSADSVCIENAGACVCQFYEPFNPCGIVAGAPTCYGQCTGSQSCVEVSGACQCGDVFEP